MYNTDTASLNRLVNSGNVFEGTSLPPRPSGGKRVPLVNNFRITKQLPIFGGALITVAWLQEELTENDYLEIFVYGGIGTSSNTAINPRDTYPHVTNSAPIVQGLKASESPFTLFVPVQYRTSVTIYIATRHSSGMISEYDFLNSVSTTIDPGTSIIDYQAASAEVTMTTAEITLYTTILKPSDLGLGKGIQLDCNLDHSVSAGGNITFRLKANGTTVLTWTETAAATGDRMFQVLLLNNPETISAQKIINVPLVFAGTSPTYASTTIDTTSTVTLTITAQGAVTEKVIPICWLIRKI